MVSLTCRHVGSSAQNRKCVGDEHTAVGTCDGDSNATQRYAFVKKSLTCQQKILSLRTEVALVAKWPLYARANERFESSQSKGSDAAFQSIRQRSICTYRPRSRGRVFRLTMSTLFSASLHERQENSSPPLVGSSSLFISRPRCSPSQVG